MTTTQFIENLGETIPTDFETTEMDCPTCLTVDDPADCPDCAGERRIILSLRVASA